MRFLKVNTMPLDKAFAFARDKVVGFGLADYKPADGEEVVEADGYPADAHVVMDDAFGRALGGILGNAMSLFIASRPIKETIASLQPTGIQYLPLTVRNHKNRPASQDYFIINPLGTLDCVDAKASEIEYFEGDVVGIDKLVLSGAKLKNAPHLFRVREDPEIYVVSLPLLKAFLALPPRPKNVYLDEIPLTPA